VRRGCIAGCLQPNSTQRYTLQGDPPPGEPVYPLTVGPSRHPYLSRDVKRRRRRIVSQTISSEEYTAVVDMQRESYLSEGDIPPKLARHGCGKPAEDVMLMPSYQGVKLTPGPHIVRFEYSVSPLRDTCYSWRSYPSSAFCYSTGAARLFAWMEQKAPGRWHAGCSTMM